MIRTRRATENDSTALRQLILAENPAAPQLIAYDRGSNFFDLYRHLGAGPERYWVAEDESGLTGVIASFEVRADFAAAPLFYITDTFVAARNRGGRSMLALTRPVAEEVIQKNGVFFALEETPQGLEPFSATGDRWGLWMKFIGESVLHEFTLQHAVPGEARLTRRPLQGAETSFLNFYASKWEEGAATLSPRVDTEALNKILSLSPDAHFLTLEENGEIQAGLLCVDLARVRAMRRTPRALAVAAMGSPDKKVSAEIPYLQWSLPWGDEKSLARLTASAAHEARAQGYEFAGIRDAHVGGPHIRRYAHRILLGGPKSAPLPRWDDRPFRLDPLFL